jgi:hypothetical protein
VVRGGGSPGATEKDAGSDVSPVEASKRKIRGPALPVGDGNGADDDDAEAAAEAGNGEGCKACGDNVTGARKKLLT